MIPVPHYIPRLLFLKAACAMLLFLFIAETGTAQTVKQLTKAGDEKFSDADYYAASLYYQQALRKDDENLELNYKFAEASRMFSDYKNAAEAYRTVIKMDKTNKYPMAAFWLAEMLKSSSETKYKDALKQFQRFRSKYRQKDYYAAKAQQQIESTSWAIDHLQKNDSIKIDHLGKEVNTEKSEFNAIHVFPDKLQYSSLRNIGPDEKHAKYLVRLYNQPPTPQKIYMPNGVNPEMNIGNGAYSPDAMRFYFTQCEQVNKTNTRCDIYLTQYKDFRWMAAEKLSVNINDPKATNTQPALGYDAQGNEILFFASDRENGYGQLDIWLSRVNKDGTYEKAMNAGKQINTQGSEVTPFYDINNHQLYFASDWHYGFGGFDIFSTKGEYNNWSEPQNLLEPINTPQNDLYYSVAIDNSKAYITSNRIGSYFIEAETCCNDIYAYNTGKKVDRKLLPPRDTVTTVKVELPPPPPLDTIPPTAKIEKADTPEVVQVTSPQPPVATIEEPRKIIDDKVRKVKQLLPVTLYFHNDEPDCCNLRDTTNLEYQETYEAYSAKLNEYKKQFTTGLTKTDKEKAQQEVFNLFTDKVDKGFYDLVAFSSQLLGLLQQGNKIEITIKGYCSPLNFNKYNIQLGYRRIASLRNYFFHYRDGILLPYVQSGQLVLKNESMGEETSPKTISDKLEDTRNSVYNPSAALERRVEIVSVELK